MSWYEEAVFYHIYPLGLCGAPMRNDHGETVHRINDLIPWIDHISGMGFTALYIGPLFESVGHGYETTDYYRLDRRLGDNDDLKNFVSYCHEKGIKVIFDAVFNHSGRDFFAFRDIRENRENSPYLHWYQDVDLHGNNEYNDGFSYAKWGGYDLLAKFNLYNEEVRNYLYDVVRFWVSEFDIDGLRLDAADVLEFGFMSGLRSLCSQLKEDFWLMGEVIHGEYSRWVGPHMLNAVTNYHLYKALYSAHNYYNYFEIAHTVNRQLQNGSDQMHLYSFTDNHDVERIIDRLRDRRDYYPVHVLLFTLPGIPSIYYGSEFAVEGRKERFSDASIRPKLDLKELQDQNKDYCKLIKALCLIHRSEKALSYGDYRQLFLTTAQYAFARGDVIVTANNSDDTAYFEIGSDGVYRGCLSDETVCPNDGRLHLKVGPHSAEIWIPDHSDRKKYEPVRVDIKEETVKQDLSRPDRAAPGKAYEEMSIEELQAEILAKMEANGPLNDRMIREVKENIYRDSLINWVRSFR